MNTNTDPMRALIEARANVTRAAMVWGKDIGDVSAAKALDQAIAKLEAAALASAPPAEAHAQGGGEVVDRALEYLRPHLESGTFTAPGWAIQLASILTGGDGCGAPPTPSVPVEVVGHVHPHAKSSDCHCIQCRPLERPCDCGGCRSLSQQPASVDETMVRASADVVLASTGETRETVGEATYGWICDVQRAALTAALINQHQENKP